MHLGWCVVLKRVVNAAVAFALMAGGVGVAVLAVPFADYPYDSPPPSRSGTEVVSVVERSTDLAVPTALLVEWTTVGEIRSASVGLVTNVFAEPGVQVACGVAVMEVDAQPVISYCGARPLSSTVSSTSRGADTDEFFDELRALGFFVGVELPTVRQRADAIRFWQAASRQAVTGAVKPDDLVWIGAPITPTSVPVSAGAGVVVGDTVLRVDPQLSSAVVTSVDQVQIGGRDRVFVVDGVADQAPLSPDGEVSDLPGLQALLDAGGLLNEGLPDQVNGSMVLVKPVVLATVPATAVVLAADGTCVYVLSDSSTMRVEVEVVASSLDLVFVEAELEVGAQVLVDPDRTQGC
jgi:hypothetical protein